MFYYSLEVALWQLSFLTVYLLFIKKETFYQLHRIYLVGSFLMSFALPFWSFHSNEATSNIIYQNLEPVLIQTQHLRDLKETGSYGLISTIILIVSLLLLFYFSYNTYKIYRLYKKGNKIPIKEAVLIEIEGINNAFTFLKYIFIEKNLQASIKEKIISHEYVHVKEKHSFDIILLQLIKIIFWYNPLIYFYEKELKEIHEYITDKIAIQSFNKREYFNLLLQIQFKTTNLSFVQAFSKKSLLKKRINMQNKKESPRKAYLKYSLVLVVIIILGNIFNACKKSSSLSSMQKESEITNEIQIEKRMISLDEDNNSVNDFEVAYQFLKNPPEINGCEGLTGKEAKKCFSKKIRELISQNFNMELVSNKGTNDKTIKIITQFIIDKNGEIKNIKARSKYKEFEDEAKRVIALLPSMKPATQNNKPVNIVYTLPIIVKKEK